VKCYGHPEQITTERAVQARPIPVGHVSSIRLKRISSQDALRSAFSRLRARHIATTIITMMATKTTMMANFTRPSRTPTIAINCWSRAVTSRIAPMMAPPRDNAAKIPVIMFGNLTGAAAFAQNQFAAAPGRELESRRHRKPRVRIGC